MHRVIVALSAVAAFATAASADVNYVFYAAEKVQWGSAEQQLVLPRTFAASPDMNPGALASEAFHRLQTYRGSTYAEAALTLDRNFASTGAVDVVCGAAAAGELHVVVSEIYWTLRAAGVREIRVPELRKEPLLDTDVPLGAASFVAELWQILPPATPGPGYVRLGTGLEPAFAVRQKLDAGDKVVTAAVLALLASPIPYVRIQVVPVAIKMTNPAAEPALLPLLQDPDARVKRALLAAFEGTKSKKVLAALEQVAQSDPDPLMKSAAVRILNAAGNTKFSSFLLFDKLKDPDDGVVMDAVDKLGKGGKPEVAMALIDVLGHKNAQVREMAMKAIVALNNTDAIRKVLESESLDMKYRSGAATILSNGADEDVDRGLRHLVVNGTKDEQVAAIGEVAKRRRYKLVSDVIGALGHADAAVRLAAAACLGQVKDSKGLGPLADALRKNPGDKDALEGAIIAIFGGLSLEEVIKVADEKDATLRQLALKSLAKFAEGDRPPPRVVEVLTKKLADTDKDIRRSAAFALARIPDPAVVASLVALKDDPDGTIREQVAIAVAASKLADADAVLLKFLDDTDKGTKRSAVEGLRTRKVKSAMQKLRFLVENPDDGIRRAVMHAVVELSAPEDWEGLFNIFSKALFDQDAEVKTWAVRGISVRRDPRIPGLLAPLAGDADMGVQVAALTALGGSGDPAAVEYIAGALIDPHKEVKVAALDALGALKLEGSKKPLQEFIKNEPDKDLKAKANEIYDSLP